MERFEIEEMGIMHFKEYVRPEKINNPKKARVEGK